MKTPEARSLAPLKILDVILLALLVFFAYQMTFWSGERGFFAFDQSLAFDGGYRVLSGQVPYKDFVTVHGCLVFLMQGLFFKLLGVNYFAYIFGAASVNVAAALLALCLVRLLFPGRKLLSHAAGFLTAVWFYPPFGTPWHKQTGFFFALAAMVLVSYSILRCDAMGRRGAAFCFLGGAAAFLCAMGYQAVGLLVFPLFPALIVAAYVPDFKKASAQSAIFLAGFLSCGLLFSTWIWLKSDWNLFWTYTVEYPMNLAAERIYDGGWGKFVEALLMGFTSWVPKNPLLSPPPIKAIPLWIRLLMLSAYAISVVAAVRYLRSDPDPAPEHRRPIVAAVFCIGLVHVQYFFIASTLNSTMNGLPYIGIVCAVGAGLLAGMGGPFARAGSPAPSGAGPLPFGGKSIKIVFVTIGAMAALLLSWKGIRVSLDRRQHYPYALFPARFSNYLDAESLDRLKWGDPSVVVRLDPRNVRGADVKERDILGLLNYLRSRKQNFFVVPDYTILDGLAGVPSPQPLLWFHRGWTYPRHYDRRLDEWVVADLVKNKVEIAVLEDVSFLDPGDILLDFPLLAAHLEKNFAWTGNFGMFNVFEAQQHEAAR